MKLPNEIKKYFCPIHEITSSVDFPEYLYVGATRNNNFPILLPFKKSKGFIYDIGVQLLGTEEIMNVIQSVVLKLFLQISKNYIKVSIIDLGYGATLKLLKQLDKNVPIEYVTEKKEIDGFLENAIRDARKNGDIVLERGLDHISDFNLESKITKPYHIIVIPNFPKRLSNSQISLLNELMLHGNTSGTYLILGYWHSLVNQIEEGNGCRFDEYDFDSFTNNMQRINIGIPSIEQLYNVSGDITYAILNDEYDHVLFSQNEIDSAIEKINDVYKKTEDITNVKDFLSIPIGYDENGNRQYFSLGQHSQSYHVMISGVTGSGKTTFFNNIITQIAEQYSADEVRLYLMDYKEGVEFDLYRGHPNVELLHLDNDDFYAAINTLETFVKEAKSRANLFRKQRVSKLDDYNELSDNKLHRKILIIDEIQRIFKVKNLRAGDLKFDVLRNVKELLETVAKQGRSFGLHLIACTQTFKDLDKIEDFRGQFNVRIGFRHEERIDANPLGIKRDLTDLQYYQIIYRTPRKEIYVPKLDNISSKEVLERIAKHKPYKDQVVIEPNQDINSTRQEKKQKKGGFKKDE